MIHKEILCLCLYRDIFEMHALALILEFFMPESNQIPFALLQDQT